MAFQELDGPAAQIKKTVTDTVVQLAIVGGSALSERHIFTIQPKTGKIYIYFGDGVNTPNAATVQANGIILYKNGLYDLEASPNQPLFVLGVAVGNTDYILVERG
jgi:hypothetical protein